VTHASRSARKANEARRARAAHKQRPVPAELQAEIAAANRKAKLARYPVPPVYADSYERKPRNQPSCYDFDGALLALAASAARRLRRR
jgi:hypothetical protein